MQRSTVQSSLLVLSVALPLVACSKQHDECTAQPGIEVDAYYDPVIDPADFTTIIDNPYLPWVPGTVFTYDGTSDGEPQHNVVTVTDQTRVIMGVTCVAVDDRVEVDGELQEQTTDWYAQDNDGNVWYFGEDSTEYEDGNASTEGSWLAGVDGGLPGIVMKADPQVGDRYRQEYLPGEAEDAAEVSAVGESVSVQYDSFDNAVRTREWTPLEACVSEDKWFAPGVGFVKSTTTAGEQEDMELVSVTDVSAGAAGSGGAAGAGGAGGAAGAGA